MKFQPRTLLLICVTLLLSVQAIQGQAPTSSERSRGRDMLLSVKEQLAKKYYDPAFHGMDLDARFKTAEEKIKTATSNGQILGIIAQILLDLNDSHTFFLPPSRVNHTDYGWSMQIVGDRCFVSDVDKDSDAEKQGVKIGDEVLEAGGVVLGRDNLWKFQYLYNALRPQPGMKVTMQNPAGERRELTLMAKISQGRQQINLTDYNQVQDMVRKSESEERMDRDRFQTIGKDLLIWKMNEFDLTDEKIDQAFDKAKNYNALILDLRDNGGGFVTNVQRMLGNLFDHDIKIGDEKSRKETKPMMAKTRGNKVYQGKLVVLVNSASASASEVFSKVIQLEKRGIVVGDQTAGAVMTARRYDKSIGLDVIVLFGVSITESDLIMTDGHSLEKLGVTPDFVVLPTGLDLATNRDVVLSKAASQIGVQLDPEKAGQLFPRIARSN